MRTVPRIVPVFVIVTLSFDFLIHMLQGLLRRLNEMIMVRCSARCLAHG